MLLRSVLAILVGGTVQAVDFELTKIVDTTVLAPGAGAPFTAFGNPAVSAGHVAFWGQTSNRSGIYFHDGSNIVKVADTATAVPGTGATFDSILNGSYAIETNRVAFFAGWSNDQQRGLFVWENGQLSKIASSADAVPGSALQFGGFGEPQFDRGELYAFGFNGTAYRGVFRFDAAGPVALFGSNDLYPGTTVPLSFSSQFAVENGVIAFWGALNAQTNSIFVYDSGTIRPIASSADVAPGLNQMFNSFNSPPDMGFGQVGFVSASDAPKGLYLRPTNGGPIVKLADSATVPPAAFSALTGFETLAIAGTNRAYLLARNGLNGIYLYDGGTLKTVADSNTKFDGLSVIAPAFFIAPQSYKDGVLAFTAHLPGAKAIYAAREIPDAAIAGTATLLARTGTTAIPGTNVNFSNLAATLPFDGGYVFYGGGAGTNGGTFFWKNGTIQRLLGPSVAIRNGATNTTVSAVAAGDGQIILSGFGPGTFRGLFSLRNGTVTPLLDNQGPLPGSTTAAAGFSSVVIDGASVYALALGADNYYGIYRVQDGVAARLYDTQTDTYPGLPDAPLTITSFAVDNGRIALLARPGQDFANVGLFVTSGGGLIKIAAANDPAPGRPVGDVLGRPSQVILTGDRLLFSTSIYTAAGSLAGPAIYSATIDNGAPQLLVGPATRLPGLFGRPSGESGVQLIGPDSSGGFFFTAANGTQRLIYRYHDGNISVLLSLDSQIGGESLSFASIPVFTEPAAELAFSGQLEAGGSGLFRLVTGDSVAPANGGSWSAPLRAGAGEFQATFTADLGRNYRIEYSADLKAWTTLTNLTYTVPIAIGDTAAAAHRFFRAVLAE